MTDKKIGFIGFGNMANAIITNLIKQSYIKTENLYIFDKDINKCLSFKGNGINVSKDSSSLCMECEIIFLCVKPQNYDEVLCELSEAVDNNKIIVSIAAGISTGYITKMLDKDAKVIRAMPNTPLMLGFGATALSKNEFVKDEEFEIVKSIFDLSGITEVLPESQMNTVISINGSSPAYIYLFAKSAADYAEKNGFDRQSAIKLFAKTLEGSAKMILEGENTLEELISMVCSPGGTTLKAIESFKENNFEETVYSAMEACTKRAAELGK